MSGAPASVGSTVPRPGPLRRWRLRLVALMAVVGPGLLAGLSDDDPAGITTYSVLGTDYGYQLLWVLALSTLALIIFHGLAVRVGVVTGQGLLGLVRDRYGPRVGSMTLVLLLIANLGTTCAELAGVAAGLELFGVSRYIAVPVAAAGVSLLVLKGAFHRVEHVLIALAAVFVCYVVAGVVADPDWGAAVHGLVTVSMPVDRDAAVIVCATVGTTLAPWGLSFIQSYAVDKKLTVDDLPSERIDVVVGSILTGVIGFFVVVTCAATLHPVGASISDATDAADALRPLVGKEAPLLFGAGLIGAAVLAAAILPLSTAYSVCEFMGREGALDDGFSGAPLFYSTYVTIMGTAAALVLLPGVSLVPVLVLTQVLNLVLVLPLMVIMYRLGRDPGVMGTYRVSERTRAVYLAAIVLVGLCVTALAVLLLPGR
ncbi:divalent metal cation transporter [Aeromicrobium sp. S22]|uniref:NRAMP family divalent metal transporter n=1 Tax=Aeromicrobium sp. S22 TaxID=2662029 RepID=UPI00129EF4F2|nr:divalent metal cation transporter [Aeromicrobium sp. S22]MRK00262.1 divalent metal cation transporter [Aeromicrobium sp. S22]